MLTPLVDLVLKYCNFYSPYYILINFTCTHNTPSSSTQSNFSHSQSVEPGEVHQQLEICLDSIAPSRGSLAQGKYSRPPAVGKTRKQRSAAPRTLIPGTPCSNSRSVLPGPAEASNAFPISLSNEASAAAGLELARGRTGPRVFPRASSFRNLTGFFRGHAYPRDVQGHRIDDRSESPVPRGCHDSSKPVCFCLFPCLRSSEAAPAAPSAMHRLSERDRDFALRALFQEQPRATALSISRFFFSRTEPSVGTEMWCRLAGRG